MSPTFQFATVVAASMPVDRWLRREPTEFSLLYPRHNPTHRAHANWSRCGVLFVPPPFEEGCSLSRGRGTTPYGGLEQWCFRGERRRPRL